jgi:hypothetical protein
MTATYVSTSHEFQSPLGTAVSSISSWIKQTLAVRSHRRATMRSVRYLRGLDRKTLEDIGVDVNFLNDPAPSIVRVKSYVIAMSGNRYFEI